MRIYTPAGQVVVSSSRPVCVLLDVSQVEKVRGFSVKVYLEESTLLLTSGHKKLDGITVGFSYFRTGVDTMGTGALEKALL